MNCLPHQQEKYSVLESGDLHLSAGLVIHQTNGRDLDHRKERHIYLVAWSRSVTESPREIPISKRRIFINESFQNVSKIISEKELPDSVT